MTLENKLGITDSIELARTEEKLSKAAAVDLYDSGKLDSLQPGTFGCLSEIHKALFDMIYEFAGQMRHVNLAKGNFRFASVMYLESAIEKVEQMPQSTFDEIVEKYIEMNVAHPFREGNGRAVRIWLDLIFKTETGKVVDRSKIDKEDYLLAMERSPIRDTEIKLLLRQALTDRINDRELFMKGIDHSYAYEGYSSYRADSL